MIDLYHPAVRSLLLPFGLALVATGVLRALPSGAPWRRWAGAGLGLTLLVVAIWTLGWRFRPASVTEKLPWVYAAAALLGLALESLRAGHRGQWVAAAALWAAVLLWFGGQPPLHGALTWLAGAAMIGAVLHEPRDGANAPAMLLVAGAGLALVAMLASSLLLFELTLALCAALAGCALWLWPRARIGFGASACVPALLAWLALAQGTALLTRPPLGALLLLAGASSAGLLLRALRRRPLAAWVQPLVLAAIALLWAAAAVALTLWLGAGAATGVDDPYYKPDW